jgi:hypothetical protein
MWKTNCLAPECGTLILVHETGAPQARCPNCSSDLAVATEPFTEQDWLTSDDPYTLLQFARRHASVRKMWLFCYASARRHLDPLVEALDRAERHAGEADDGPARAARWAASDLDVLSRFINGGPGDDGIYPTDREALDPYALRRAVVGRPGAWDPDVNAAHLALLRDVVGNPFRKARLSRSVLNWNDKTVPMLARSIFDERRFAEVGVLADALEEAGCTDADILSHLRLPGPHVRGCWAVDLLLGRQ